MNLWLLHIEASWFCRRRVGVYTEWAKTLLGLRWLYCMCTCLAVQAIRYFNHRLFLHKMKPKPKLDKCVKI